MKRFTRADIIDTRHWSPEAQEAGRQLCLAIHRAMERHRDDPGARPYFAALERLAAMRREADAEDARRGEGEPHQASR